MLFKKLIQLAFNHNDYIIKKTIYFTWNNLIPEPHPSSSTCIPSSRNLEKAKAVFNG